MICIVLRKVEINRNVDRIQTPLYSMATLDTEDFSFQVYSFSSLVKVELLEEWFTGNTSFFSSLSVYSVLMCQDLSCGTKDVTSGADDHSLHKYHSVNVHSQVNAKNLKSRLGQVEPNKNSKYVEAGGGGDTLLCWRIVGLCQIYCAALPPQKLCNDVQS